MPHGAGRAGGGGGGFHGGGFRGGGFHGGGFRGGGFRGGGFRGGGFRRHRILRPHPYRRWWWWGGPGYYNGDPGYYAYGPRLWACACFWIWMVVALVIIAIVIGIAVAATDGPSSSSSNNQYTPGATRIISADSTFCSGLTLSGTNTNLGATLYSLSRPPALTRWNNFTLQESDTSVPNRGYVYYQFYLRTGSTANGSSCIPATSPVSSMQLLIIRGTTDFNSWVGNPRSSKALYSYTISQRCPGGNTFAFQATQDDYFFFVYYNGVGSTSGSVTVDLQLFRKEYTVDQSAVMDSCKYDGVLACDITTSGGATYLLVVDSQVSASVTGDFSVNCIANGGIIAVIVIVPLLVLALVVGLIIVLVCCYRYKHTKKAETSTTSTPPTASDPMVQPAQPEAPPAEIITAPTPPAYNPNYAGDPTAPPPYTPPAPAPSYGSTAAKPPGY